jgi:crotonobetainyl-CoA:carnitine CoA-transferase CaiB-like acyl-CoA transferase
MELPENKALEDLLVVELTSELWSALAAAILGDFGASVVRVETPENERAGGGGEPPHDGAWDWEAELAHRNKRSVYVDTGAEPGRVVVRELIDKADVVLTDWPRAKLAEHGFDFDSAAARNLRLLYAHGSGFGPRGPDADLPAIDELAAARTGMMPILPQPGQPPVYAGAGVMYTAVMLALGISIALHYREETGEGQEVDASLYAANMYGASLDVQAFLAMGGERFLQPIDRMDAGNPMSGVLYPAADGKWVCLTMPDTDRWWPGLAQIVGLDVADERFDTHDKRCGENRLLMMRVLEEKFGAKPSAHWKHELTAHQLSADVIEDFAYPADDPQAIRNRYIVEVERPGLGKVKTVGFPIYMSDTPARLDRAAPARGQHTAQVLHDVLDYSEEQIGNLAEQGVVNRS